MSCQSLKARRFQIQPRQTASPNAVEVLATGEAALTPVCWGLAGSKRQLQQLLFLEPGPATSHSMVLSLAPELHLPTTVWLCPSHCSSRGQLATLQLGSWGFSVLKVKRSQSHGWPLQYHPQFENLNSVLFNFKGWWSVSVNIFLAFINTFFLQNYVIKTPECNSSCGVWEHGCSISLIFSVYYLIFLEHKRK